MIMPTIIENKDSRLKDFESSSKTVVRASDWARDIVVKVDRILYAVGEDIWTDDDGQVVIDNGVIVAKVGDKISIIGSANGEYAFRYDTDRTVFSVKIGGDFLLELVAKSLKVV